MLVILSLVIRKFFNIVNYYYEIIFPKVYQTYKLYKNGIKLYTSIVVFIKITSLPPGTNHFRIPIWNHKFPLQTRIRSL